MADVLDVDALEDFMGKRMTDQLGLESSACVVWISYLIDEKGLVEEDYWECSSSEDIPNAVWFVQKYPEEFFRWMILQEK